MPVEAPTTNYRKQAEECRSKAKNAPPGSVKDEWQRLAKHWEQMAQTDEAKPSEPRGRW